MPRPQPNDLARLAAAFEGAIHELRLTDRNDPAKLTLAKKIIELAREGERDPLRLRELAVKSLTNRGTT